MSVLFIALPLALLLGAAGVTACVYCIRDGQYDDLDSPPMRILVDEQKKSRPEDSDGTPPSNP
ncbi:cbb3-type cytochrome oxidase assembly protein CcoS [Planctomycetes bacterium K23_9]|uniref:Cytochrome oxidase maturation protein cbb3-type n=1 Tax=Stieleria marina TaxID=1930275 RepID=A0A517NR07_9BACT|nr:Cytochrome oxidase maturation protein cbb3-type [Planctomycetes bacterium K23_9]